MIDQFRQLQVRSRVVKQMASIYIQNHLSELMQKSSVIKLLASEEGSLKDRFEEHIQRRVDAQYPLTHLARRQALYQRRSANKL